MGLFSSIGKIAGGLVGGILGHGSKIKYPDASKTIIPRDIILSKFYSDMLAPYGLGLQKDGQGQWQVNQQFLDKFSRAPENYEYAARLYGQNARQLADYTRRLLPDREFFNTPVASVISPFGVLPAYGLQKAALRNKAGQLGMVGDAGRIAGLLANLYQSALLTPAQTSYKLNYLQPLNLFTQQDLARYRVQAQPYGISASPGLLGYAMASFAQPLGSWAFDKFKNWWG